MYVKGFSERDRDRDREKQRQRQREREREMIFFILNSTTGRELAPPLCKGGPSCATVPVLIKECMRSQSRKVSAELV